MSDRIVEHKVAASQEAADFGVQDVVVIAVKGPALQALAPQLIPLIGPDTLMVPAMNGVPWWFLLAGGGELGPTTLSTVDPKGVIGASLLSTA
jgi:2-dehydropantoate 2-reductase